MTDKEKEILNTFKKIIPNLSELGKEKLLSFGEGMAIITERDLKRSELNFHDSTKAT